MCVPASVCFQWRGFASTLASLVWWAEHWSALVCSVTPSVGPASHLIIAVWCVVCLKRGPCLVNLHHVHWFRNMWRNPDGQMATLHVVSTCSFSTCSYETTPLSNLTRIIFTFSHFPLHLRVPVPSSLFRYALFSSWKFCWLEMRQRAFLNLFAFIVTLNQL